MKGSTPITDASVGCLVTGNEDGVKHCAMNVLYSLQHLGYTIPPQADAGWIGEAGPGPSYLDPGSGGPENDFTNRNTAFMTWNLLHLARMLKDAGGVPAHGNQRTEWDAGCRTDYPNPDYRSSARAVAAVRHAGRAVSRRTGWRARRARPGRRRRRADRRAPRADAHNASTTSARSIARDLATLRALALFTIGETPWSAAQRASILERVRRGRARGVRHPLRDRLVLRLGRLRTSRRRALRRTSVDPDVHHRRLRPDPSRLRAPRVDLGMARRGVPVPRPATPTRRCSCACATASSISTPPVRDRPASVTRSRGASPKARARVLDRLGHFPGAWESPAYLRHLAGRTRVGARGRVVTRARQLLGLGVLASASRHRHRRRSVSGRRRLPSTSTNSSNGASARGRSCGRCSARNRNRVPLDPETTDSVDCGSYRRERIVFDTEQTMSVPAYLLVPHERTEPGSGRARDPRPRRRARTSCAGSRRAVQATATRISSRARDTWCSRPTCAGSASAPDVDPPDKYHCDWNLVCATMAGVVPLERNLWDLRACPRRADRAPAGGPDRVAAVGFSYGGTCALFLAALDDRVAAAVVSGYLSSWAPRTRCRGTCADRRCCPRCSARSSTSMSPRSSRPGPCSSSAVRVT